MSALVKGLLGSRPYSQTDESEISGSFQSRWDDYQDDHGDHYGGHNRNHPGGVLLHEAREIL